MLTIEDAARDFLGLNESNPNYEHTENNVFELSIFKAGAQFAIDELASKFEQLKQSATTLRDVVYLDGVLTVIESMKIENNN